MIQLFFQCSRCVFVSPPFPGVCVYEGTQHAVSSPTCFPLPSIRSARPPLIALGICPCVFTGEEAATAACRTVSASDGSGSCVRACADGREKVCRVCCASSFCLSAEKTCLIFNACLKLTLRMIMAGRDRERKEREHGAAGWQPWLPTLCWLKVELPSNFHADFSSIGMSLIQPALLAVGRGSVLCVTAGSSFTPWPLWSNLSF